MRETEPGSSTFAIPPIGMEQNSKFRIGSSSGSLEKSGRGRGWVGLDKEKGILHVYFIFHTLSINEAYKKCDILENCWEDWELD